MDEGGGRGQGQVLGSQGPPAQKLTPSGGAPGGPGGGCDAPRHSDASRVTRAGFKVGGGPQGPRWVVRKRQ